jgi:hypothetical protein
MQAKTHKPQTILTSIYLPVGDASPRGRDYGIVVSRRHQLEAPVCP